MLRAPLSLVLASLLLAGCATTPGTPTPATSTVQTTTPTPMMTPPTTMPGIGMAHACPAPMGGMMDMGTMMGHMTAHHAAADANATEIVFTLSEPTDANPCYGLTGPATSPSGWVNVTLRNGGVEAHQAALLKMGNMTPDHFLAMMHANFSNMSAHGGMAGMNGTMPAGAMGMAPMMMYPNATPYGGPLAMPGGEGTTLLHLDPGHYAVVCWMPGPDGMPHAFGGMMTHLTVVDNATDIAEPTADLTITLTDYAYAWSANLTPGMHAIRVVNEGDHQHEAPIVKLTGNATTTEWLAAYAPNATAPPPISLLGGTTGLAPGKSAYFWLDVTPGNWALACFEVDDAASPPHFTKGMTDDVAV